MNPNPETAQLKTVGAGLLANAVDQSMNQLNDTPHSRSHIGIFSGHEIGQKHP
jgi:hypothetical protein